MSKIEKEFNQKAKQISIEPSVTAWPALNERMNIRKKKKKPQFIQPKLYTTIVTIITILLICLVAFFILRSQLGK